MGYNQISGQRTQRIEAVSDGVFSIAMTLLVFNIKVLVIPVIHSEKALMDSFWGLMPQWLSYFLSFINLDSVLLRRSLVLWQTAYTSN